MPKMKTNQSCCKALQKDRYRKVKKKQSLQEPYLNKEVHEEKEKSQKGYHHRRNQRKEHEESIAIFIRSGRKVEGGIKTWQESKAD